MKEKYADIIVNISHEKVDRAFQYRIPESLVELIRVGTPVQVPFGKGNKLVKGYVIGVSEVCNYEPEKMKAICTVVKDGVSVEDQQIGLAAWIHKYYGGTMIQALKTVLPVKQTVKSIVFGK